MDSNLKKHLENNKISYELYEHPAVFTVAESDKVTKHIPGERTKNLFLKDEKDDFYLVSLPGHKRLDIKILQKILGVSKLRFGTAEELKNELHLTPGSVSLLGLIHAKNTTFIIDSSLWNAEFIGVHPNINTETLVIPHYSIEKFLTSVKIKPIILDL